METILRREIPGELAMRSTRQKYAHPKRPRRNGWTRSFTISRRFEPKCFPANELMMMQVQPHCNEADWTDFLIYKTPIHSMRDIFLHARWWLCRGLFRGSD